MQIGGQQYVKKALQRSTGTPFNRVANGIENDSLYGGYVKSLAKTWLQRKWFAVPLPVSAYLAQLSNS
jgi:hypothetical protein